jgi:peptidylprolyl isomerase
MSRVRTWSLVVLSASVLGLAGCSSSPSSSSSSSSSTSPPTTTTSASVPTADLSPAGTFGTEPTVTVPPGAPPTQLETSDLIVGTGPAAKAGDTVTVQYVLATYSTGKVIQASWTSQPFPFKLGAGDVIPGWDQGVVGMKVGGRRELIIPPSLGYGAAVPPGSSGIAANDTLVFVVDLLKVG